MGVAPLAGDRLKEPFFRNLRYSCLAVRPLVSRIKAGARALTSFRLPAPPSHPCQPPLTMSYVPIVGPIGGVKNRLNVVDFVQDEKFFTLYVRALSQLFISLFIS